MSLIEQAEEVLDCQPVQSSMILDEDFVTCPACGRTVFVGQKLKHAYACKMLQDKAKEITP